MSAETATVHEYTILFRGGGKAIANLSRVVLSDGEGEVVCLVGPDGEPAPFDYINTSEIICVVRNDAQVRGDD